MKTRSFLARGMFSAALLVAAAAADTGEIRKMDHTAVIPASGLTAGNLLRAAQQPLAAAPLEAGTRRSRPVEWNWALLDQMDPESGMRIGLPLFDDVVYEGIVTHGELRDPDSYTCFGKLAGVAFADFMLVRFKDAVILRVSNYETGRTYTLESASGGPGYVRELAPQSDNDCATPPRDQSDGGIAASNCNENLGPFPDSGEILDVMIIYTANARNGAGGTSGIIAKAQQAIADMNQRLSNSLLSVRVRLAYVAQTNYSESGDGGTDLNRLKYRAGEEVTGSDGNTYQPDPNGYMDDVFNLRETYRTDLVSLIVETMDSGGVANIPNPLPDCRHMFSIVRRTAIDGGSFAHELGHNLGNCHSREQNDCDGREYYPYSFGKRWSCTFSRYHDTMSSDAWDIFSTRTPYYSNPSLVWVCGINAGGQQPMGDNGANASRTIDFNRYQIANNYYGDYIRYVDVNAGSGQNGSPQFPYRFIGHGIVGTPDFGTVSIAAGNYTGATGVFSSPRTFEARGGTVVWH